jgi:hypothetical protein
MRVTFDWIWYPLGVCIEMCFWLTKPHKYPRKQKGVVKNEENEESKDKV